MRSLAVLPLAALLLITACSGGGDDAAPAPSGSTSAASPTFSNPTPTSSQLSETDIDDLACQLQEQNTGLLANSWERVRASVGRPDHDQQLEDFAEDAADLTDEASDRGCAGAVEASTLSLAAATLRAQVLAAGTGTDAQYQAVADAGTAYVAAVGDDAVFTL